MQDYPFHSNTDNLDFAEIQQIRLVHLAVLACQPARDQSRHRGYGNGTNTTSFSACGA